MQTIRAQLDQLRAESKLYSPLSIESPGLIHFAYVGKPDPADPELTRHFPAFMHIAIVPLVSQDILKELTEQRIGNAIEWKFPSLAAPQN